MSDNTSGAYFVYALLDNRFPGDYQYDGIDFTFSYKPFYVGKGSGNRVLAHYRKCNLRPKTRKNAVIIELNRLGLSPLHAIVACFDTEAAAYEAEAALVRSIGRNNLTNDTNGGQGSTGYLTSKAKRSRYNSFIDYTIEQSMRAFC